MARMSDEQIRETLHLHEMWLKNQEGGVRANLCGANLRGADLRSANLCVADLCGADLCGANLRGANLRSANLRSADLRSADLRSANLCVADLCGADLCGANLRGANLRSANLRSADLRSANLCGADLCGANLRGADLRSANLCGADLCGANLRGANLRSANLCGANLRSANLRSANLCVADLDYFKADLIGEILKLPDELDALRAALVAGKIDGSTYIGSCACLAGTLANARGVTIDATMVIAANGLQYRVNAESPREKWFLAIRPGDTPETSEIAKLTLEWIDEAIAIRDHIRVTGKAAV